MQVDLLPAHTCTWLIRMHIHVSIDVTRAEWYVTLPQKRSWVLFFISLYFMTVSPFAYSFPAVYEVYLFLLVSCVPVVNLLIFA